MLLPESLKSQLPANATTNAIRFVDNDSTADQFVPLPPPLGKRAITVAAATQPSDVDVVLLTLPLQFREDAELLSQLTEWINADSPTGEPQCLFLTLQGVQLLWSPHRIALFVDEDRCASAQGAVLQVTYCIGELVDIENELGSNWSQLEADTPLAFQFRQCDAYQREQLQTRFQQVIQLRVRLSRVTPFLLCPHVYPPTLASQLGERLRERTRVEQREEFVSDQLEVFEEIYEMCGQRVSEATHAHASNTLEWAIIVLLIVQILFSAFDYLTSLEVISKPLI